jgi:hypothetical protein
VSGTSQLAMVSAAGLCLALMVILIARRGILSMRYTLGWLFVAACLGLGGLFGGVVDHLADALNVQPVAIVLTAVMVGFLGIAVQLSISVSGLIELVRTLAETNAILEQRLDAFTQRGTSVGNAVVKLPSTESGSDVISVGVELEEFEDGRHKG